ncbi:STAS domain-containing protein [Streptomyces sp. NPDC018019]|uniref:STAS domain-containing protein n=1 Tax=Streptomyces sp. NPDC018019 TaxID=3365030 RepID=UPI003796EB87
MPRPAQYHLLTLPDGSWETVSYLASVIRCRATTPTVIVDVSAVERLTIDALAVLVRKAMRLRSAGGELLLTGPGPAIRKVIERTGTGPLLPVFPGCPAAVRALADDGRAWQRVELTAGRSDLFAESPPPPP